MSLIDINKRLTRFQKEKNNFQAMRDKLDAHDLFMGQYRDEKRIKNLEINYGLFNGKLDISTYDDAVCFNIGGEKITLDYNNISHYPLISQIANAIVGEQEERPFNPMVKSNRHAKNTLATKEYEKNIKNYLSTNVLQPKREDIIQNLSQRYGITDLFSMSIEEQQQFGSEVEGQLIRDTPEEIIDYLTNDFTTSLEKQAQKMLDFLVEYNDIWYQQLIGFKHAVITGEEYYYQGIRNEELVFEYVPPMYFQWGGSQRTEWVQHGTWAKLESWYTEEDIVQRHFKHLSDRDIKDLAFYPEPIGGVKHRAFYDAENNVPQQILMETLATNPALKAKYSDVNIKNQRGQQQYKNLVTDVFGKDKSINNGILGHGIRESHIVFRDKRILKRVTRIANDKKVKFWVDEHYQSVDEDYEVTKHWIDEVWEGYKLGTYDNKYVGIQPIPYQYKSLDNPNNVDLPYSGKRYNTHDNVQKNVSMIDIGKTLQKDFDTTMASIKHDLNTGMGKGFMIYMNMIPEGIKWQDWMDVLRNSGLMIADPHKKGSNGFDAQFLKPFDLDKAANVANKVQIAEYFRTSLARTMYFNDTRLGQIGQYSNVQNTQANEVASYKQTALFFTQHNKILEKTLNAYLNVARFYYKDFPEKAALFLDDVSLAELIASPRSSYKSLGIMFNNSAQDIKKLDILRNNTLSLIQNPQAMTEGVLDLVLSNTEGEIRDIIKRESLRAEKNRQEQLAAMRESEQVKAQTEIQKEQIKQDREDQRLREKLRSQELRTQIDSRELQMANDVNMNQLSDLFESKMIELEAKLAIHNDVMDLEREKLGLKEKLEKRRK